MVIQEIDDNFARSAQLQPEDVRRIAEAGYKGIVCARPDGEDAGQPAFAEIAEVAERFGLKAVHVPVAGAPTPSQLSRFKAALAEIGGPVLGYCRSGGRAASLYAASR